MNKYLYFFLLVFLCLIGYYAHAEKVKSSDAADAAIGFFVRKNIPNPAIANMHPFTITRNMKTDTVLYVFNMKPDGFIIISADDNAFPVIGYSFNSQYQLENNPPAFKRLMSFYCREMVEIIGNKSLNNQISRESWASLTEISLIKTGSEGKYQKKPLLLDNWNQGKFYNEMCPPDSKGPGGHALVGCVAVAMAQVMNYYKYPFLGLGKHSYYSKAYGLLGADFGSTTYDWNRMPNAISESSPELARMLYHCGVAVEMNYGSEASGSFTEHIAYALYSYFRYANTIRPVYRYNYSDKDWKDIIRGSIDKNMPVIYSGIDTTKNSGHAFVCDGYQDSSFFHFNWGWGGAYNGYYNIDRLNPDAFSFTNYQLCIINIYPKSEYPYYCQNQISLTAEKGVFEDGSGNMNYRNAIDCKWLIAPAEAQSIVLTFDRFDTEINKDFLIVYDGETTDAKVIAAFSGGDTALRQVQCNGNRLLVRFLSDAQNNACGWSASYYAILPSYCQGVKSISAAAGIISDGSDAFSYNNMSNCKWHIKPPGAKYINLSFKSFNTEKDKDIVKIVDPAVNPPEVLGIFSGDVLPPDVTALNGEMLIIFITDNAVRHFGWSAEFSSANSLPEQVGIIPDFNISPNPAKHSAVASWSMPDYGFANIVVYDVTGRDVIRIENARKQHNIDISRLRNGMYFVSLEINDIEIVRKLFKH